MTPQVLAARAMLSSFAEKAWPFIVQHWKLILIVLLAAALFLKMRSDYQALEEAMEVSRDSYETQIEGLRSRGLMCSQSTPIASDFFFRE